MSGLVIAVIAVIAWFIVLVIACFTATVEVKLTLAEESKSHAETADQRQVVDGSFRQPLFISEYGVDMMIAGIVKHLAETPELFEPENANDIVKNYREGIALEEATTLRKWLEKHHCDSDKINILKACEAALTSNEGYPC